MLGLLTLDQRLFRLCYAAGGGHLLPLMIAATIVGSGWTMFALVPLLIREATRKWALALTLTLLATAVAVFALKMSCGRARPIFALAGVHPLYGSPTDFSFPSGHSAGSFATAAFVSTVGLHRARQAPEAARAMYLVSAFMMALATTIAYSRIYLGVHFPGDVLVGGVLGASLGVAGGLAYVARGAREAETAAMGDKSAAKLAPDDVAGAD